MRYKKNIRVIPRLDVKGPNLVKGVQLEGLRVLGKPEIFAQYYYLSGADEIIYIDVVASLYGRNSLLEIIRLTSKKIFIPLTVGGGLRSIDDIRSALLAGADKVSLNTAAIADPGLIREASRKFGSSTIIISIEAIRKEDGSYEAFTDNGRESTGVDPLEWAIEAERLGAGELLVTSINYEGTGKGFDNWLVEKISSSVSIPVIACGGAGNFAQVKEVVTQGKADAVAVASIFHYNYIKNRNIEGDFQNEGNLEFLSSNQSFGRFENIDISQMKMNLNEIGFDCRIGDGNGR